MGENKKPLDLFDFFFDLLCIVMIATANLYLLYFSWKIRFRFISVISHIVSEIKLTGDLTGTNRENFVYAGFICIILFLDMLALIPMLMDIRKIVMTMKYYYRKLFSR